MIADYSSAPGSQHPSRSLESRESILRPISQSSVSYHPQPCTPITDSNLLPDHHTSHLHLSRDTHRQVARVNSADFLQTRLNRLILQHTVSIPHPTLRHAQLTKIPSQIPTTISSKWPEPNKLSANSRRSAQPYQPTPPKKTHAHARPSN